MNSFLTTVKFDYLQRTRSYAFLITLCISLATAYTFVPEPNAAYSTIRIGNYQGVYNAAWFGYVTAIMTASFLSLIGFYLVNSSIKNDQDTKVGQIVSATKFTNFKYLLSKVLSNFLVLITIGITVFGMSISLFFLYNDGFTFEILSFVKPYVFITFPALFVIAALAILFEVILGRFSIIQNVAFFFLFTASMTFFMAHQVSANYDIFGGKIVTTQMEAQVNAILQSKEYASLSIGFTNGPTPKKFYFSGIDFPMSFILSRLLWMLLGIILIAITAPFFHRFNIKERVSTKKTETVIKEQKTTKEILLSDLPKSQINYGIFPLLKTELLLLFRQGQKWLWLLNLGGMLFLAFLSINIAHQIILPILWFFQVSRLAALTTKEVSNHVHYFACSSYKPLSRLLTSQLLAGIILMVFLATPLILRLGLMVNYSGVLSVIFGGVFIVLFAAILGILTKGKKLFEVLFFMLTYANINGIQCLDYFGATGQNISYVLVLILGFASISFFVRKYEMNR